MADDREDGITGNESASNSDTGSGPLTPTEMEAMKAARPRRPTPKTPDELVSAMIEKGITGDPTRKPSHPGPLSRIESGPVIEGRFIPSPSLSGVNITALDGYETHGQFVRSALDAFNLVTEGLVNLDKARTQLKKDTSRTESGQVLALAAEAEKLLTKSTRAFDNSIEGLTGNITLIEGELNKPLKAKADTVIGREVRDHVKGLSKDARNAFMRDALQNSDHETLQAVLGTHAYLSGLDAAERESYTRQYNKATNPELVARLEIMTKARLLIEQRGPLLFPQIEKALGARFDVVKKLRETSSAAAQALLLINNPAAQ